MTLQPLKATTGYEFCQSFPNKNPKEETKETEEDSRSGGKTDLSNSVKGPATTEFIETLTFVDSTTRNDVSAITTAATATKGLMKRRPIKTSSIGIKPVNKPDNEETPKAIEEEHEIIGIENMMTTKNVLGRRSQQIYD